MPSLNTGPLRLFGYRRPPRLTGVITIGTVNRPRRLHFGASLHRAGGFSIIGVPRRGGTTVVWGESLRERLDTFAWECRRHAFGPVSVHVGEDF